jgi:O-Antigen ligase
MHTVTVKPTSQGRTVLTCDYPSPALVISGEQIWARIGWTFLAYWGLFVAGSVTDHKELNSIGGMMLLAVLAWSARDRLWVRLDSVAIASLAAALIPLLHFVWTPSPALAQAYVKYASVCMAIFLARTLHLPEASTCRKRWLLALGVIGIVILSLTVFRGSAFDGGARHSGLFPNPNNLALIPFLLLCLLDRTRDTLSVRIGAHVLVITVLGYTGTSGAILAYGIGLIVHLRSELTGFWRGLVTSVAVGGVVAASALLFLDTRTFVPETRLTNQIAVIHTEFQNVLRGDAIAYYDQVERELGPGTGSAIWRLAQWRYTIAVWSEGSPIDKLVGFGPGSTTESLGILPHNEYVRVLYEAGIVGLALFGFSFYGMIRTAPPAIRYVGLIFAIYSFSENNLDNFPFMALLVLCLSAETSAKQVRSYHPKLRSTAEHMWLSRAASGVACRSSSAVGTRSGVLGLDFYQGAVRQDRTQKNEP